MLQEATASKLNTSASSSTFSPPTAPETNPNNNPNNSFDNNNRRSVAQNAPKKQHTPHKNPNQKFQLRNGTDDDHAAGTSFQRPQQQQSMNQLGSKLQRLKLAKSANKERILQPGPFPRTGSRVKISASLPAGIIYIYHNNADNGDSSDYHKLGNRVYHASKNAQTLKQIPRVDDVIFAPFMGGFYRAKVLTVKEDLLEIQFPDFGNISVMPWKTAKEIADEDLKWAKYLTFPVKLEGIDMFSKDQKELLDNYEESVEFELVKVNDIHDSEMQEVVLKRLKETVTLNMQLIDLKENLLREKKKQEEQKQRSRLEKESMEKQSKDVSPKIPDHNNYAPVLYDVSLKKHSTCLEDMNKISRIIAYIYDSDEEMV